MLFIFIKHCLILHKKVLYKWSVCCRLRAKKRNHLFFVFLCPICVGPSTVRNKQHSGRTDKSGWCFSTHRRKVCIYVLTTTMRTYSVTVKNTRPVQIQIIIFPREGQVFLRFKWYKYTGNLNWIPEQHDITLTLTAANLTKFKYWIFNFFYGIRR